MSRPAGYPVTNPRPLRKTDRNERAEAMTNRNPNRTDAEEVLEDVDDAFDVEPLSPRGEDSGLNEKDE